MQVELRTLFYDAVTAFTEAEGLPLSLPNIEFDPPKGKTAQYLMVYTLPIIPSVISVCGEARHRFALQMSVFARDDMGELEPLRIVDKLKADVFPIHKELIGDNHTFKVIVPLSPSAPVYEDGWFSIPMTLTVQTIH